MSLAIIANPIAGRGRAAKTAEQISTYLREKNYDFEMFYTSHPGEASELANRATRKHPTIAALGGDGTINEVVNGLWQTNAKLGIIPSGTGNDYARGLGLPLNAISAVDTILRDYSTKIDLGMDDTEVFGVVNSIGFPATVIDYVNNHRDSRIGGHLAVIAGLVKTIRHLESYEVKLTIDGQSRVVSTIGIFIMNMPYAGGGLKFAPDARYDDGCLSVLIVKDVTKFELIKTLPKVYNGRHLNHPCIEYLKGNSVQLELGTEMKKIIDGEIISAVTINANIAPLQLATIIPRPQM